MDKIEALETLQGLLLRLNDFRNESQPSYEFKKWQKEARISIERIFGNRDNHLNEFNTISFSLLFSDESYPKFRAIEQFQNGIEQTITLLQDFIKEINHYWKEKAFQQDFFKTYFVENICANFHAVARHLACGNDETRAFSIASEFEVQNTFHAFLKLFFDRITFEKRPNGFDEEYSDLDFVVNDGKLVATIKTTLPQRPKRQLREEILHIVRHYQLSDCKHFICFVYDPEHLIKDPEGFTTSFEDLTMPFPIKVVVQPT